MVVAGPSTESFGLYELFLQGGTLIQLHCRFLLLLVHFSRSIQTKKNEKVFADKKKCHRYLLYENPYLKWEGTNVLDVRRIIRRFLEISKV